MRTGFAKTAAKRNPITRATHASPDFLGDILVPNPMRNHAIVVSSTVQELEWYASREQNASRIMVEVSGGRAADEAEGIVSASIAILWIPIKWR
jgi:hypothetical protein